MTKSPWSVPDSDIRTPYFLGKPLFIDRSFQGIGFEKGTRTSQLAGIIRGINCPVDPDEIATLIKAALATTRNITAEDLVTPVIEQLKLNEYCIKKTRKRTLRSDDFKHAASPQFDPEAEHSFTAGKWGYDRNANTVFFSGKHQSMAPLSAGLLGVMICNHPAALSQKELTDKLRELMRKEVFNEAIVYEITDDLLRNERLDLLRRITSLIQRANREAQPKFTVSSQRDKNDRLRLVLPLADMNYEEREGLGLVQIGQLAVSTTRHTAYYDGIAQVSINKPQVAAVLAFFIQRYGQRISYNELFGFYRSELDHGITPAKNFRALNEFLKRKLGIEIHRDDGGQSYALCTKDEWAALINPTRRPEGPAALGS